MKECELIKGGHTFGLVAVKKYTSIYNLCFPLKKGKAEKQVLRKPWVKKGLSSRLDKRICYKKSFF